MGFCFSCCRRRENPNHPERNPLLSRSSDALQPPSNAFEKVADVFAAAHTGKLPTQQQVNTALQKLLKSELLSDVGFGGVGGLDKGLEGDRKNLVGDFREVAEAVIQVGLEKNDDNLIQEVVYHSKKFTDVPVQAKPDVELADSETVAHLDTLVSAIPSEDEAKTDIVALITSLRSLASLLITSSTFRILLSDILVTSREFVADAIEGVAQAAAVVEVVAERVEAGVRPGVDVGKTQEGPVHTHSVNAEKEKPNMKDAVLNRIEEIIRQAQADPAYNASLRTLLYLLRKYAHRVQLASSAVSGASAHISADGIPLSVGPPIVIPDPSFLRILTNIKTLLERFASRNSLDPLLTQLSQTANDILAAPASSSTDIRTDGTVASEYFNDVGKWLDRALSTKEPTYTASAAGKHDAEELYDRGRELLSSDTGVASSINALLTETDSFISYLRSDRSTNRLISAISSLGSNLRLTTRDAATFTARETQRWHTDLLKLLLGWLMPRLLRAMAAVPMPRVEYIDTGTGLEVAVDAMWLGLGAEVVPDMMRVSQASEVQVDVGGPLAQSSDSNMDEGDGLNTTVKSISKVAMHVEGLRLAAYDVGYYAKYAHNQSRWLSYVDEGLLSVKIGKRGVRGDGMKVDVEVELGTDSSSSDAANDANSPPVLFHPTSIDIDIPGLTFDISHSHHWILNSIAQPLLGPIVRRVAKSILEGWVRSALEGVEKSVREVGSKVEEGRLKDKKERAEFEDWWRAAVEVFGDGGRIEDEDEDTEEDEPDEYTETQTSTTFKGVVRTTITQPEPSPMLSPSHPSSSPPSPPAPTETTLAIGLGAQVLPGKGEPSHLPGAEDSPEVTPMDVARQAIQEVQEGAIEVGHRVKAGMDRATEVREEVEGADKRLEVRERVERRRKGWKSRAFDL